MREAHLIADGGNGATTSRLRLYLAGPDVFGPDAPAIAAHLKTLARRYGFEPLWPLDHLVPAGTSDVSLDIFQANRRLIQSADVLIANLSPFRGAEPDSGTAWEVGFAAGRGIPVFGYIPSVEPMIERVHRLEGFDGLSAATDCAGRSIEDFGCPVNLMLAHGVTQLVIGSAEEAIQAARAWFAPLTTNPEAQLETA